MARGRPTPSAVIQDRDERALDQLQREGLDRRLLPPRVDGDQGDGARGAPGDVVERAVRLEAHQEGQLGDEGRGLRGDAPSTLELEGARQDVQTVCRLGVALEAEVELDLAALVGGAVGQRVTVPLLGALRIVEVVVRVAREGRKGRTQRQRRLHAPLLGRRAEEVVDGDARLELLRADPPLRRLARQPGGDPRAVGQELLHPDRGRADLLVGPPVLHEIEVDGVGAGRRRLEGRVGDLAEAGRAERDLLALHGEAPRVEHLGLERQPGAALGPARRLHDHADVEGVTRPVDPPVGEEIRRQLIGDALVLRPADVEAREIEATIAPVERQEAQVGALAHHVHQR